MKKRLRIILSIVIMAPLLASGATALVSAESSAPASNSGSSNNTSSKDTTLSDKTGTTTETDKSAMLKRLAEHETELKTKLTTIEQTHIKDRCKQAQSGGINSLGDRIKGIETSRNEVYTNLLNRLNKLVEKLKTKGVDTAKLESEIAVLKTKIDTFKADLAVYKQDVADLKAMDCSTDPTAFKAALVATRTEHDKLRQEAIDIRTYVNGTIKVTLKDIRSQLDAKEKTTTETDKHAQNTTGGN